LDRLDVKSEVPEQIEDVTLADLGVVVMGDRGRVEYATAPINVNESARSEAAYNPLETSRCRAARWMFACEII
jgi:hypothetical protein